MAEIVKVCKKHGELTIDQVKPYTLKSGAIGYRCNPCQRIKYKEYRARNKDILNAKQKANRDKHREYHLAWSDKNREYVREYANKYYQEHKNILLNASRLQYRKHKDKQNAQKAIYYLDNKEKYNEREKKYVDSMTDYYLKKLMIGNSKILQTKDLNVPALIELKRATLALKRKIRDEQHRGT